MGPGNEPSGGLVRLKTLMRSEFQKKNIFFGELEPDLGLSTVLYIPSTYVMALDNWGGGGEGMVFDCDLEYRDLSYRIL